jgi:hypothetical protein
MLSNLSGNEDDSEGSSSPMNSATIIQRLDSIKSKVVEADLSTRKAHDLAYHLDILDAAVCQDGNYLQEQVSSIVLELQQRKEEMKVKPTIHLRV